MALPGDVDERIALALDASRAQITEQVRAGADQQLRTLVGALRLGRWGSWWCQFGEPVEAVRRLSELARYAVPQLLHSTEPAVVVRRVIEVIGDMATVVVAGERASWERETHRLQQLVEAKDDMFRLTVHELRGPLGKVRGYLSLLTDHELATADANAVRQAQLAAEQLVPLVDGLAAVVRLEDGAGLLQRTSTSIGELVDQVVSAARADAGAKTVTLEKRVEPGLVAAVDAGRLQVAMANLVLNAIRYAPPDSHVLIEAAGHAGAATIAVSDQGPGMTAAEASIVFEAHRRGASAQGSGLGLGLWIVRRIVEAHGGAVSVATEPGRGATFTITLPTDPSPQR